MSCAGEANEGGVLGVDPGAIMTHHAGGHLVVDVPWRRILSIAEALHFAATPAFCHARMELPIRGGPRCVPDEILQVHFLIKTKLI